MLRAVGIALVCLVALAPTRARADRRTVVVKEGDVLGLIAERSGVSVAQIKAWNGLRNDTIRVGQKLVVQPTGSTAARGRARETDDGIDWTPPFDYGLKASRPSTRRPAPIAARDPKTAVAVRAGRKHEPSAKQSQSYRIRTGDTLVSVARRQGTTARELLEANPGIDPNRIYPGQTINIVNPRPKVRFRLERGDTLLAAARRYDVNPRDIARWNADLRGRKPGPGTSIRLYTRKPVSASEAIGPTNSGRLKNAVRLPAHRGYVIRTPARAYGTEETIRWMIDAFDAVDMKFKQTKVVRVHDISDRDGGKLRDHKSHQNGRDVDISYYQSRCSAYGCRFDSFRSSELDVARQWTLLEHWLRNGQAEMIFIDYRLQARLYRYARRKGVSKAQLDRWMQYPRSRYEPRGVIRHFPNHADHLHVRFVCPYSDPKCRP